MYDSNSKVTHDNETLVRSLTPGGAKTRRMVEIGRVNQPGACMAEAAVLLGEKTKTTIGTITPTTVAWIPAEAFRVALVRPPLSSAFCFLSPFAEKTDARHGKMRLV